MSVRKQYVLDANVFIEAHQRYYSFDICPGFWLALVRQHQAGRVFSIDRIRAELVKMDDALRAWVQDSTPGAFFKGTADKKVSDAFTDMVNWVQNEKQFTTEAKEQFSSGVDGWLAAYAKANGLVVVTHEEYSPDVKKRVLIPNVCLEFKVDYCNTFEMLRELGERFVLKKRQRRS